MDYSTESGSSTRDSPETSFTSYHADSHPSPSPTSTTELTHSAVSSFDQEPLFKRSRHRSPSLSQAESPKTAEEERDQLQLDDREPKGEDALSSSSRASLSTGDSDSEEEELEQAEELGWEKVYSDGAVDEFDTDSSSSSSPPVDDPSLKTSTSRPHPSSSAKLGYDREAHFRSVFRGNPFNRFWEYGDFQTRKKRKHHLDIGLKQALASGKRGVEEVRLEICKYLEGLDNVGEELGITEKEDAELWLSQEGAKGRFELKQRQRERAKDIRKPEAETNSFDEIPVELPDPVDLYERAPLTDSLSFVRSFKASELFRYDFEYSGTLRYLQPCIDRAQARLDSNLPLEVQLLDPMILAQCVKYSAIELLDLSHDLANYCAGQDLIDGKRVRINSEPKGKVNPSKAILDCQLFIQRVLFETLASSFSIYLSTIFLTGAAAQYVYGSSKKKGALAKEVSTIINPFGYPPAQLVRGYNLRHGAFTAHAGSRRFGCVIAEYSLGAVQYFVDLKTGDVLLPSSTPSLPTALSQMPLSTYDNCLVQMESIYNSLAQHYGRPPGTSKCVSFKKLLASLGPSSSLQDLRQQLLKVFTRDGEKSRKKNKERRAKVAKQLISLNPNLAAKIESSYFLAFPHTFSILAEKYSFISEELDDHFISPQEAVKVLKYFSRKLDDETRRKYLEEYGSEKKFGAIQEGLAEDRRRRTRERAVALNTALTARDGGVGSSTNSNVGTPQSASAVPPPRFGATFGQGQSQGQGRDQGRGRGQNQGRGRARSRGRGRGRTG
ncbi:hypothetical protein JCM5350_000959 [Sporobolomyces pararoseus]